MGTPAIVADLFDDTGFDWIVGDVFDQLDQVGRVQDGIGFITATEHGAGAMVFEVVVTAVGAVDPAHDFVHWRGEHFDDDVVVIIHQDVVEDAAGMGVDRLPDLIEKHGLVELLVENERTIVTALDQVVDAAGVVVARSSAHDHSPSLQVPEPVAAKTDPMLA